VPLPIYPCHNNADKITLLLRRQFPSLRDTVPLCNAAAAAGCGGMLGCEDGMAAHRGLFAVIARPGRGYAALDEIGSVMFDGLPAFGFKVGGIGLREFEF
jgi:hypothetical protein